MSLPWETTPGAEAMQPDTPVPAAAPEPIPAVAVNPATGQKIGVDLAPQLQAAITDAITTAVTAHPVLSTAVRTVVRDRERGDRAIMQGSLFDVSVAVVAALVTFISPASPAVPVLWIAAAALASRTLIQGAVYHARPEVAP